MSSSDGFSIPQSVLKYHDLASSPYTETTCRAINSRRESMPESKLFLDQLLAFANVDGPGLYPPSSPASLRRLLASIHSSPVDRLKKDCFYYYLLLDADAASIPGGAEASAIDVDEAIERGDESKATAAEFAKRRCMPKTWRVFMEGYWNLDNGRWEEGISALSDPAITSVNCTSAIIQTLATLVSPPSKACSLLQTFFLSQPTSVISTPLETSIYAISLASTSSVSTAFGFIRARSPGDQHELRQVIWSWALGSSTVPCGAGTHTVQKEAVKEILHLPLLPDEDDQLLQFLLHPPVAISPSSLSLLHDLVTLRLIHQGKYAESLQLDKELAGTGGKEEDRQRRREMVREFIAVLPEAQRRALKFDSEAVAERREKERLVNGFVRPEPPAAQEQRQTSEQIEREGEAMVLDGHDHNLAQSITLPSSMAAQTPVIIRIASTSQPTPRTVSSPFSGPPRFPTSSTPTRPSSPAPARPPVQRILSGSPFTQPMSRGASAVANVNGGSGSSSRTPLPLPKPRGKAIINDDREEEERLAKRARTTIKETKTTPSYDHDEAEGDSLSSAAESHAAFEADDEQAQAEETRQASQTPAPRRSNRVVSNPRTVSRTPAPESPEPENAEPTSPTPSARSMPPPPPSTAKRRTRQSAVPGSQQAGQANTLMPGTFASVPENEVAPISPTASRRSLSVAPSSRAGRSPGTKAHPRSRMTRSTSRALLDDHEEENPQSHLQPAKKRTRRKSGASDMSDMSAVTSTNNSVRRSTRTKGQDGGAVESERGSPTPSIAASAVGRRRREASQTPRATKKR